MGAGVHNALDEVVKGHDSPVDPPGYPPVAHRERVQVSDETFGGELELEEELRGLEHCAGGRRGRDPDRVEDGVFIIIEASHAVGGGVEGVADPRDSLQT